MKDSIVVIGTHITNYKSNFLLTQLVSKLIDNKIDYGIVANSSVSDVHFKDAKFFMFDSENDKLGETDSSNFWFENEFFKIESPLLNYGAISNYSFGATNLFINSVILSKRYGYRYLHWLEYDSLLNLNEIEDNEMIFRTTDKTCVVYETMSEGHPINGSFISVDLGKIRMDNFFVSKDERIKKLNEYGNSGEKFTKDFLLKNEIFFTKKNDTLKNENQLNQAKENNVEFVYYEYENDLHIFLKNNRDNDMFFLLKTNLGELEIKLGPFFWETINIGKKESLDFLFLTYNNVKHFVDTKNKNDVEKYITRNKFYKK